MGVINEMKTGADLTHPRLSATWIIGASVAISVLLIVIGIGSYMYRTGKKAVTGVTGTGMKTAGEGLGMSGIFGDGT